MAELRHASVVENGRKSRLIVNDKHSQLNETRVSDVVQVTRSEAIVDAIERVRRQRAHICVAGGRHAMGGQQFLEDGVLLDMSKHCSIQHFDAARGFVTVSSGINWIELIEALKRLQVGVDNPWVIIQKQTGADALTIGGALSANIHGRGLAFAPFVRDIEQFTIVLASGERVLCSRSSNVELFQLAIGGYGAFGVIDTVTLRLQRRQLLRRSVRLIETGCVIDALESAQLNGAKYGDFQFTIDHCSPDFLARGILSTYAPVRHSLFDNEFKKLLTIEQWRNLLMLAHSQKTRAFDTYASHYLETDGQLYWSDTFQLGTYVDNYHTMVDEKLHTCVKGSEMITELYVPRSRLAKFMQDAANFLRQSDASVIYGTIRLIEQDNETFLAWADQRWACIVLNLHVDHSVGGLAKARASFLGLIRIAISHCGKFYLTYHRYAGPGELLACYPQMGDFLSRRREFDPENLFRSNWLDYCVRLAS